MAVLFAERVCEGAAARVRGRGLQERAAQGSLRLHRAGNSHLLVASSSA